ncbi:MAG: hypothetical protein FJW56_02920 [Actinobacteria bacterium]|nr:hypothetical protein [Actinomycetota bacterium]
MVIIRLLDFIKAEFDEESYQRIFDFFEHLYIGTQEAVKDTSHKIYKNIRKSTSYKIVNLDSLRDEESIEKIKAELLMLSNEKKVEIAKYLNSIITKDKK